MRTRDRKSSALCATALLRLYTRREDALELLAIRGGSLANEAVAEMWSQQRILDCVGRFEKSGRRPWQKLSQKWVGYEAPSRLMSSLAGRALCGFLSDDL